jgi:hypothetical protein
MKVFDARKKYGPPAGGPDARNSSLSSLLLPGADRFAAPKKNKGERGAVRLFCFEL